MQFCDKISASVRQSLVINYKYNELTLSWLEPGLDLFPAVVQNVINGKKSEHNMVRNIFMCDAIGCHLICKWK